MEITPEIRSSHEAMCPQGMDFLEYMSRNTQWHKPVADLIELPQLVTATPEVLLTWLPLMSTASYQHTHDVLDQLIGLIRSIPRRLFDNDPKKLMQAYPFPTEEAAADVLREPQGATGRMSRSDLVWAPDGWKLLEVNSSALVAGVDLCFVAQKLVGEPILTDFLNQHGLTAQVPNIEDLYFIHMVEETLKFVEGREGGQLNVGVWLDDAPELDPQPEALNPGFGERLGQYKEGHTGHYFMFSTADQLEVRDKDLYFMGHRIHLLIRMPFYNAPKFVVEAFKHRRIQWFGLPMDMLLSDKRNLGLLSANGDNPDLFNAEERSLIERHIPWSRLLVPGPNTWRGEKISSLVDLVIEKREQMMLKPFIGHAGKDVYAGAATEPDTWKQMVEEAAEKGGVLAQEMIESRPFLWHYRDQGMTECRAVWGVFRFGEQDGGTIMRNVPMANPPGVINSLRGASTGEALVVEKLSG